MILYVFSIGLVPGSIYVALLPGSAGWVAMSGEWRGELSFLAFEVARPAASGLRSLRTVFRVDRPSR
jgi:hypothetical protein